MEAVLQTQNTECGIACLAMISAHHGNDVGLRELRRRFGASQKGVTLGRLMETARALDLSGRAVRVELDALGSLDLPCILHWNLNHFVVLERVSRTRAWIIDPANGKRVVGRAEMSSHFTGVALEITPSARFTQRPPAPSVPIRQLTGHVRGIFRALLQVLALSLSLQVFAVLGPFLMQWVIDQVLVSGDEDLLTVLGLSFSALLVLQVAIAQLRGWSVIHLSNRLGLQWGRNVFSHLLKLPLDYFEKRHLGDIVSRMGSVQAIQRTLTTSFVEAIIDGLMAVVTVSMMLLYSWKLALVSLCAVALYALLRALSYGPLRQGTEEQLVAAARQQTHLLESLRGMQTLKVSGSQVLRESAYQNLLNATANRDVRVARLRLAFGSASQLVFGVERIAVVWIGAIVAMQGVFSVGMLIAYLAYKDQFAQRIGGLIDKWFELRMLRLHGERLADIALTAPEAGAERVYEAQMPERMTVQVCDVSFGYSDAEAPVLDRCSFSIEEGESVAIVGPSGCGKTTLVKVLLGLLEPQSGKVCVGGQDIRELGLNSYRAIVGAVMQDDRLFAGSIADNIAFGEEALDMARVEESGRLAAIHDDVATMPMGYHSLIGDMGTVLSGGQKQRILLARALYRRPRLLILDEATSHLDVKRERMVNMAIKGMRLTTIVIAHRPETIASADRVIKMRMGRVLDTPGGPPAHARIDPALRAGRAPLGEPT